MKHGRRFIARGLARSFLTTSWNRPSLVAAGARVLLPPTPWLDGVVDAVMARFSVESAVRYEALWRFLSSELGRIEDDADVSSWRKVRPVLRALSTAPVHMRKPVRPWPVPAIDDPPKLARWLGLPASALDGWADTKRWLGRAPSGPLQHYFRYWIAGRSGPRLIEAPKQLLARIQRRILRGLLVNIPVHDAAHGFVKGRSTVTHARAHCGQQVVLRLDLRRFFPSITGPWIRAIFLAAGYAEPVAEALGGLTTAVTPWDVLRSADRSETAVFRTPHLPQGAPTSPCLANLATYRFDQRLTALAQTFGANYTRYADDLTFSGGHAFDRRIDRFIEYVRTIATDEGFSLNPIKTKRMRSGQQQRVTGAVVNESLTLSRRELDRLKSTLTNGLRHSAESQNRAGHACFRAHLRGRVAYAEMLHPHKGAKLRRLFERIAWS